MPNTGVQTDLNKSPEERASSNFSDYRHQYPSRQPDLSLQRFPDETWQIGSELGITFLIPAPIPSVTTGSPPHARGESEDIKYLWVVGTELVPYALENGEGRQQLQRGRLAHTNLTGGSPAHSGGEMWFLNTETVIINGGSGRYAPRSVEELAKVAEAFKACGFRVAHMGYDEGSGTFARHLRGHAVWL